MPSLARLKTASTVIGIVAWLPAAAAAQPLAAPVREPALRLAAISPGSIDGVVLDDKGTPVAGAMVSAIGAATSVSVSDERGHFEFAALAPGGYLVRAHHAGYLGSVGQMVDVRANVRAASSLVLRRNGESHPVLAAGVGPIPVEGVREERAGTHPPAVSGTSGSAEAPAAAAPPDDLSETAWRIRHARRGVLKDATFADQVLDDSEPGEFFVPVALLGRVVGSPARAATSFLADTSFSGQLNLFTTSSFDAPQQLFSGANAARGIAYVRVGAPAGPNADWMVRGALSEADITSWIVAGSYAARVPARHQYDIGMSYATQRYDGGNPLALRDVADGSRNAGAVYAFDKFAVSRAVALEYGMRYAQYDYLDSGALVSPRVELTVAPADGLRIRAAASRTAHAAGAEEFQPPGDAGIWLPPQRTFSSLEPGVGFPAERTTHAAVDVERSIGASALGFGAFRQDVEDQLVTVFGAEMPSEPIAKLGHYLVGTAGDASAAGYRASFRTAIADRVQGSVVYSVVRASLEAPADARYLVLVAPSALRRGTERIHDLSTTIEADVPETATRVLVLYKMSNGFARPSSARSGSGAAGPVLDSRFDVQVRQSLPFLDFSSARWEMLVAIRSFFREAAADQSVYGELLAIRTPKRIVGGVTVNF
jgi:hypothetical protein